VLKMPLLQQAAKSIVIIAARFVGPKPKELVEEARERILQPLHCFTNVVLIRQIRQG